MILIPDELRPQLLANGRDSEHDHSPVVKLFNPCGAATWLISAIEPDDPDILYGLCRAQHKPNYGARGIMCSDARPRPEPRHFL